MFLEPGVLVDPADAEVASTEVRFETAGHPVLSYGEIALRCYDASLIDSLLGKTASTEDIEALDLGVHRLRDVIFRSHYSPSMGAGCWKSLFEASSPINWLGWQLSYS